MKITEGKLVENKTSEVVKKTRILISIIHAMESMSSVDQQNELRFPQL